MEFGGLYVKDGSTAIGGIATGGWTQITQFDTNAGYNQVIPNHSQDSLETLHREMFYFVFASLSVQGPANQEYKFAILNNGLDSGLQAHVGFGASGTYDNLAWGGPVLCYPNNKLTVGVRNVNGLTGTTLTVKAGQLMALRNDIQE